MFNRNPPPPQQQGRPQQPRNYPPQYPSQQPPPGQAVSRYNEDVKMGNGGHEQRGYPSRDAAPPRRPVPQAREIRMTPTKSPDNTYTFHNLVAVAPQDIPPSRDGFDVYILVNDQFVFSARPLNGFQPGTISFNDLQRVWAGVALTDQVRVRQFDPFSEGAGAYLSSLDYDIGFAGRSTSDLAYDQDDLAQEVIRVFENQILSPGQQMVMDVRGIRFKLAVRTVQVSDLSGEKVSSAPVRSDPGAKGILTRHTSVNFAKDAKTGAGLNLKASKRRPATNAPIQADFKFEDLGIGGLSKEFGVIFRRAFASRVMPPHIIERMGIQHVRGILLFGPPGTGKTLIARQIGKMLNAREPKVINGPEVLNKFVGQSEENIRKLFADAEKEYKEKGDESGLHIIIFDELDAVCKQRGSGGGGGTGVGDSVVNQLLSKMDGVDQLNNILIIGMTNRMDMIDDALLRPGRLEIHVEISLPDETGRVEILKVHTNTLRKNDVLDHDVDIAELASMTKNFSGAELSGLVRAATSFAMNRQKKSGAVQYDVENIRVNRDDFVNALGEIQPAFGVSEADLSACVEQGILHFSPNVQSVLDEGALYVRMIRDGFSLSSVLLHGPSGSGKTALAAQIALDSGFPFVKLLSSRDMDGYNEMGKVAHIGRVFSDAYKSSLSVVVIDNIERIIDWNPIGLRFSNMVVSTLATRLQQKPPEGRRMLVLATSSRYSTMLQLDLLDVFNDKIAVPNVANKEELYRTLDSMGAMTPEDRRQAVSRTGAAAGAQGDEIGVGIKYVLEAVAKSNKADPGEQVEAFASHMERKMLERMAV